MEVTDKQITEAIKIMYQYISKAWNDRLSNDILLSDEQKEKIDNIRSSLGEDLMRAHTTIIDDIKKAFD